MCLPSMRTAVLVGVGSVVTCAVVFNLGAARMSWPLAVLGVVAMTTAGVALAVGLEQFDRRRRLRRRSRVPASGVNGGGTWSDDHDGDSDDGDWGDSGGGDSGGGGDGGGGDGGGGDGGGGDGGGGGD